MKKFISFIVAVMLIVLAMFTLTACDDDKNSSSKGLLYKKFSGDDFYTVYGFVDDGKTLGDNKILDIAKFAEDNKITIGAIKSEAFKGNDKINGIIVPTTVTEIGESAFAGMPNLKELTVPFIGKNKNADAKISSTGASENKSVDRERTIFYWFDTTEFDEGAQITTKYNSSASETTYYLPRNFKSLTINALEDYKIPAYACYGNVLLETVKLTNVSELGEYSFYNCRNLDKLEGFDFSGLTNEIENTKLAK